MSPIEVIRWGILAAIERALDAPDNSKAVLAKFGDACIDPYHERSSPLVEYMLNRGSKRAESGALSLFSLVKLLDDDPAFDVEEPSDGLLLLVPDELMAWAEERLTLRDDGGLWAGGDNYVAFSGAIIMVIRAILHEDLDTWRDRLAGDRDRPYTYMHLCCALVTGFAFARQEIPPWIPEDDMTRLIRASWDGEESLAKASASQMYEMGLAVLPVELPNQNGIWLRCQRERRRLVLDELQRRGWPSDPSELDADQVLELSRWMHENPAWIHAKEDA